MARSTERTTETAVRAVLVPRARRTGLARLLGASALVVVSATGLLAPAADASPHSRPSTPSQAQVDAAKAAAGAAKTQVDAVQAKLDAAASALSAAQVTAEQADEKYNAAADALAKQTAAAEQAQSAATAAQQRADAARAAVGRLAAGAYRSGGGLGDLSAFLSADGPQDLLDRAAMIDSVSADQAQTEQQADAAQAVATSLQDEAKVALAQQQQAAAAAKAASDTAKKAADDAQALVSSTQATQAALTAQLAQLQHVSVVLEQQRQAGLAAAAEAAREAAARKAIATRQRSSSSSRTTSRDSDPGGSGGGSGGSSSTPSGSSQGSASGGAAALAFAQSQIGDPYVWGATGPDSYDCSGLTLRAWQHGGVTLPRTSAVQYETVQKISYSSMRPGDLIFYGTDPDDWSTVYHVAIYAGGGMMVEAPHTGADVREVAVRYSSAMTWAGRP